jgi:ElaB/YqjD/DUF883 family membrane-anchored ribosome-binding protein
MEGTAAKAEGQGPCTKAAELKDEIADALKSTKDKVVNGACDWTKAHPLAALAIAAGIGACVGLGIGLLVGRRRD